MSSEPTKRSDRREARYTYDQADRRTTMELPGGEVVAYGYDDGDPNHDCNCPQAEATLKVVTIDGDPNLSLTVSEATHSVWDPNHWVQCYDPNGGYVRITAQTTPAVTSEEELLYDVLEWGPDPNQEDPNDPLSYLVPLDAAGKTTVTASVGSASVSVDVLVIRVNSITVQDANTPILTRTNPPDANDLYLPEREVPLWYCPGAKVSIPVVVAPPEGVDYLVGRVDGTGAWPSVPMSFCGGSTGLAYLRTNQENRDFTCVVGIQKDGLGRTGGEASIDCGEVALDVHVVAVQDVEWVGVDPGDGQTNLSQDNPGSHGGGWRIFPGKNDPNGPVHNRVVAKATLTHLIPSGQPATFEVHFKVFDMDDPTYNWPNSVVDGNDSEGGYNGGDNRGTPGEISGGSLAHVIGQDFAEVEYIFPVSKMHAGNNFMVIAHTSASYVDDVLVDTGAVLRGLDLERSNHAVIPAAFKTPLLSAWRRLYVEVDAMDRPLRSQGENVVSGRNWNNPRAITPNQYKVDVEQAGWTGSAWDDNNEFAQGFVKLMGPDPNDPNSLSLTKQIVASDVTLFGMDNLTVPATGWSGPTSGNYDMVDDDCDLATFQAGQYTSTVGTNSHLGVPDLSWLSSRLAKAYIEPNQVSQHFTLGGPAFLRNPTQSNMMDLWNRFTGTRALPVSTSSFWTVQVIAAFQPESDEDGDPTNEFISSPGVTKGICTHQDGRTTSYLGSQFSGMAAVFREVLRDGGLSEPQAVVHEVAHTLGCSHTDSGIMKATNQDDWFAEDSIQELRSYTNP